MTGKRERWAEALGYFQQAKAICEKLVAKDPSNARWQNDLRFITQLVEQTRAKVEAR